MPPQSSSSELMTTTEWLRVRRVGSISEEAEEENVMEAIFDAEAEDEEN